MAFEPTQTDIPTDIKKALLDGLDAFKSFQSADPALQQALKNANKGVRVFTIGVPDVLAGGKGLSSAQPAGWRVAVRSPGQFISADIYTLPLPGKAPGAPRLACIRGSPDVGEMLKAIEDLPTIPGAIPAVQFNLHLVVMPGLFTEALWLQPLDAASSPSFLVPFYTKVDGVRVRYAYKEDDLTALLRPVAQEWQSYSPKLASRVTAAPQRQNKKR